MKHPVIWFVVFHPKRKHHWWARTFGHVSLAGWTNETWVHLDLHQKGVDLRTFYTFADTNDYLSYQLTHNVVLRLDATKETGRSFFLPMTCVAFVKHTLGVRSCALLPDQLYRILIRDYNAEILDAVAESTS